MRLENCIGQSQLYRGAVPQAIQTFLRTAAAADALPLEERQLIANNDLGEAYYEQGDYARAIAQLLTYA